MSSEILRVARHVKRGEQTKSRFEVEPPNESAVTYPGITNPGLAVYVQRINLGSCDCAAFDKVDIHKVKVPNNTIIVKVLSHEVRNVTGAGHLH